jgi:hypothetical protein
MPKTCSQNHILEAGHFKAQDTAIVVTTVLFPIVLIQFGPSLLSVDRKWANADLRSRQGSRRTEVRVGIGSPNLTTHGLIPKADRAKPASGCVIPRTVTY